MADQEKKVILTREGYEKLEKELDYYISVRRNEISEQIAIARGFGDLSENAEYEEAKNEQAFMEGRILELENMLNHAVIVDSNDTAGDEVGLGTTVSVCEVGYEDEVEEYTITGSTEADISQNKISNESPMGAALLGAHVGDEVDVEAPSGILKMKVLAVHRN